MRSTFKLLFYINRNKVKSDGTTAVLCRISIDGKKSAVTTGVYCKPGDWDSKKCEIKTARENNRLAAFRSRLEEAYGNLLRNQGVVTAELLKTTVSGANSVPEYLLQAGEVERERLRVRSKEINSTSTYRQSKTTQLNLRQFIESRGMKDIAFSDITEEFAESFKVFLKKELGHRNGHVNHCLCWLNRLIYIAVDREILRANPIEDVAYERKETPKLRHISRSELKRMMETPLPDPMMELARRTFIFSSLTGLAYADTRALHPRHIGTTSDVSKSMSISESSTAFSATPFATVRIVPSFGFITALYAVSTARTKPSASTDTVICFLPLISLQKPRRSWDKITPEFPLAPRREPLEIFLESSSIDGFSSALTSLAAAMIVSDILEPVSPSGTGNTFNSLI